jgi:hypothetical protein
VILLGIHVSRHLKNKDERDRKLYEVMYNEARRASRISLECRMEIDNMSVQNVRHYEETYKKQNEVIELLKHIFSEDDEFDLSGMKNKEEAAKDILQKIRIRQQYISDAIEKLEKLM